MIHNEDPAKVRCQMCQLLNVSPAPQRQAEMQKFSDWFNQSVWSARAARAAAWEAWHASRAAVVVELPETPNRGVGYGLWDAGKEACREAIEAAGLKVKES